jgi:hypothetical protein
MALAVKWGFLSSSDMSTGCHLLEWKTQYTADFEKKRASSPEGTTPLMLWK